MPNVFDKFDSATEENVFNQFDSGQGENVFNQFDASNTDVSQKLEDPGFIERVGEDISQRTENISEFVERQESPLLEAPAIGAVAFGQAAGAVGDIIGETIVSGFKTVVPEETQQDIKNTLIDFTQTRVGKLGLSALEQGQDAFSAFEDRYPDAAVALGSMLNIFGLSVATKSAKLTAKELVKVGDDLSVVAGKTFPKDIEKSIAPITRKAMEKSIRPSVVKGETATQSKKFFKDANEAVHTIIENKNILGLTDEFGNVVDGLPTNLRQFTESISNTKKEIFKQYDEIARISGEKGASVNMTDIANELDTLINNKGIRAVSPDIIDHAKSVKENLLEIGDLTAKEAQDAIASINNRLNSVTDFNSAAKASIDSLVANKLRESLNDVIEATTGRQYKELKKKYGSLKEIERDVNRRAMVDARNNVKGLIDFTDVFTGAEVVSGIIAMNPAIVAKGLTAKLIAAYIKKANNPNRMVKNMFAGVETAINKSRKIKGPFKPTSKTIKAFQKLTAKQKKAVKEAVEAGEDIEVAIKNNIGPPLIRRGTEFTKSKTPAPLKTNVRKGEPAQNIKTKKQKLSEKEKIEQRRQLDKAFAEIEAIKKTTGPPLIRRGLEFTKSKPAISVEQRLRNLRK